MRDRKIRQGGHTWTVKWVTTEKLGSLMGHTVLEELTIYINSDWPEPLQRETLLHELHHVALFDAWPADRQDEDDVEQFVCASSSGIYDALGRNAWAREYIWGG